MKKEFSKNKLLRLLLVAGLVTMVACGDDDDGGSTSIVVNPDGSAQQERQEGPVGTGPQIRINNSVNNSVRVVNENIRVDNDELIWECGVEDANPEDVDDDAPVIHQQFIYVAPNCNAINNNTEIDVNNDGIIDQIEVEQAIGNPVASLEQQQGDDFTVQQTLPVDQLTPGQENFAYVLYSQQGNVNIPILCMPISVQQQQGGTTGDTGGTTGGTTGTTGGTGGTTGGTAGGDTGGATAGATGGVTGGATAGATGGATGGETGGETGGDTGGDTGEIETFE